MELQFDKIKKITDNAILFVFGDESVWIPKSQIEDPDVITLGDINQTIEVKEWFVTENELEGYEV